MYKNLTQTLFLFLTLMLMTACTGEKYSRKMLSSAEQIIESNPDSALILLNEIDTIAELHSDDARALYYLLLTQAQYKCYKPTTSDSMLCLSRDYYTKTDNKKMLARTYYYMAMTEFERKHYEKSIPLLKEGIAMAEQTGDNELISKYYESMSDINFEAKDWKTALKYAKMFLDISKKMNNYEYIARAYDEIAISFDRMNQNDSSDFYHKKIIPLIDKIEDADKASLLTNIGCMYHQRNDLKTAKQYFEKSLAIKFRFNTISALSKIYLDEGNLNKAVKLRDSVMKTNKYLLKINLMNDYAEYNAKHGNFRKSSDIYRRLSLFIDSLKTAQSENKITELQLKYDKQEAESKRQIAESKFYKISFVSLVGAIIITLIIIATVKHYRKKTDKLNDIIKDKEIEYAKKINETISKIKAMADKMEELENSNAEKKHQISALKKDISSLRENSHMRLGRGYAIYDCLINKTLVSLKDQDERSYLIEYYSIVEYQTFHKWTMGYKDLTKSQLIYLILNEIKFSDKDIMAILDVSETTIRAIKSKLKKQKTVDL